MSTTTKLRLEAVNTSGQNRPARKPAEGHEVPLAAAIAHKRPMRITLMSGVQMDNVQLAGFDRWTITVRNCLGNPVTYFKHSIESFCEDK